MNDIGHIADQVKKLGITKKENWLETHDQKKIINIILKNKPSKGDNKCWVPTNLKSQLINILKFNYNKLSESIYFLNLSKKLKLNEIANNIFDDESKLSGIDFYYNQKSDKPVLDWHCDTAYSGSKDIKKYLKEDNFSIKFFFYLSDVFADNGCLSYLPGSHKITNILKKGIYNNSIMYTPYWNVIQYKNTILKKDNYKYILKNVEKSFFDKILNEIDLIIDNNNHNNIFDFPIQKGGAIIFNETGIHRGSKLLYSNRMALRFFYKKIKY
jgi:hypothetical protein